ncbi:MAG: RNA polymerase sigma factor [Acidobacteria bacterium]|nr:RNA polymerase sigma factor [Acidobacteriota bacterium]MCI0624054.1 RNA polymerase sigma factor [Acidobacteriota bacterium]MCI0724339.1 RNA polymerase sigma factor [Acidobacteriota bacterium]
MIEDAHLDSGSPPEGEQTAVWLRQAKAGDAAAFEQIMVLHQRHVLTTSLRLLGDLKDAQDAAQEVFLRLYKYLHRFQDGRDFPPWLYRVTVNVCRDFQRKRQRTATLSLDGLRESGEMPEPSSSTDLEAELSLTEKRRFVAEALKRLPEKERAAVVLRDIEGLSTREVAGILGSSEVTVRSQVSSARVKMKLFLERRLKRRS